MALHQLAIDADIIAYSAAAASQYTIDWDNSGEKADGVDFGKAKAIAKNMIRQYQNATDTKPFILCFSDRVNFRKEVWPDYKAGRTSEKPVLLGDIREWMIESFPSTIIPRLEADDVMSILSTSNPGQYTIVTMDKDLKGTPGKMLHVKRNGEHLHLDITPEEAQLWHYTQVMMGDGADGVPGLRGVGEKTAKKIFTLEGATWQTIVKAYEKQGRTAEEALRNARMLKMLDNTLYVDGEIKLWEPPC